ncbi:MAG TPA: PadR family transcriptional regulator [Solirubrobacterales bacterium]|nr:PadR family transcriptional regulator [Solirubrobacterales bacterium]
MPRRFFRHGELPLVLLALLSNRAKNGYEVMADLTRLFGPRYRASPGSVYPAIEALEAEGLIASAENDGKSGYMSTAAGEKALKARAELLAAVELRTGVRLMPGDSLEPLLARFSARVAPLSGLVESKAVAAVLDRAAVEIEELKEKGGSNGR